MIVEKKLTKSLEEVSNFKRNLKLKIENTFQKVKNRPNKINRLDQSANIQIIWARKSQKRNEKILEYKVIYKI